MSDVPRPSNLTPNAARLYHDALTSQARRIERSAGHHHPPMHQIVQSRNAHENASAPQSIDPTAFGADPTGKTDSTAAFARAVEALLSTKAMAPHAMASGIADMGGVTLDLGGGQFLLSAPVVIPPMYGNLHVRDGTLRASSSFPGDRWLVEIGSATECFPKPVNIMQIAVVDRARCIAHSYPHSCVVLCAS